MTERVGYLKSSAEMLAEHPFCGGGWGNFTFHHAINKNFGNEELAKDPHNFVAAFASQTGVFGGLLTVALLIAALLAAYKNLRREVTAEKLAIFFGLSAFSLHMLMDLDWQVIGLMLWYAVLMFAGAYEDNSCGTLRKQEKYPLLAICSLLAVCTVAGGIHWSIADSRHYALLETAGQLPGAPGMPLDSFSVDRKAEAALSAAPYSHSIYMTWGNDALRRGNLPAAEARYLKALEIVPRSHAVHDRLGDVYKMRGDMQKAAFYCDKADKLFPYKKIFFEKRQHGGIE
jgi:tetratricopeptide (TPR) repeat protein